MRDPNEPIGRDEREHDISVIRALPKVELHLHLEGAAPPAFIRGMAKEKSVRLDNVFAPDGSYDFRDFGHFLQVYEAATSVLASPEDYARLTLAMLEQSAENGVIYSETFISPDFCGGGDLSAWKEYLQAMREASEEAGKSLGITLRGVVTCIRHFGPDKARRAAMCAAETAGDWIVGFGMGGDEARGSQRDFAYSFDMAREAGLKLTSHAGEWRGPREVEEAVRDLGVGRVGHGVRAIEDPRLVDNLVEKQIVLEVCPGSNVMLGVYPNLGVHPIEKLRERGVKVTISTDDPPFFHTSMADEYEQLARTHGWDAARFAEIARTSADAAFCDEDTRAGILKRLDG
ncbi:adenosine deaminase [Salipiger aestuarii]|uniref:adenosine deaminase n=1 Tax=Salipiger aestuarii TaxID=568098 RepID=UPI001238C541|nr:adenosine deaminase [Salipiger aestuarii]KAA8613098.1 adenosine deaminase [Salipiger aestuarii]